MRRIWAPSARISVSVPRQPLRHPGLQAGPGDVLLHQHEHGVALPILAEAVHVAGDALVVQVAQDPGLPLQQLDVLPSFQTPQLQGLDHDLAPAGRLHGEPGGAGGASPQELDQAVAAGQGDPFAHGPTVVRPFGQRQGGRRAGASGLSSELPQHPLELLQGVRLGEHAPRSRGPGEKRGPGRWSSRWRPPPGPAGSGRAAAAGPPGRPCRPGTVRSMMSTVRRISTPPPLLVEGHRLDPVGGLEYGAAQALEHPRRRPCVSAPRRP